MAGPEDHSGEGQCRPRCERKSDLCPVPTDVGTPGTHPKDDPSNSNSRIRVTQQQATQGRACKFLQRQGSLLAGGKCFQETPGPPVTARDIGQSRSPVLPRALSPSSKLRLRLGRGGATQGPKAQPLPGMPHRGPARPLVPRRWQRPCSRSPSHPAAGGGVLSPQRRQRRPESARGGLLGPKDTCAPPGGAAAARPGGTARTRGLGQLLKPAWLLSENTPTLTPSPHPPASICGHLHLWDTAIVSERPDNKRKGLEGCTDH